MVICRHDNNILASAIQPIYGLPLDNSVLSPPFGGVEIILGRLFQVASVINSPNKLPSYPSIGQRRASRDRIYLLCLEFEWDWVTFAEAAGVADEALELSAAVQTTTLEYTHTYRIPYPLPSTCPARGMTRHSSGLYIYHVYKADVPLPA